jgi:F0F1-type ATP synthase assembly protein I
MTEPTGGRGPVSPLGFAVLGSELAGFTVIGVLLDWWLATLPWLTIVGTFAGLSAAFVHMAQMARAKPPGGPKEGPKP